MAIGEQRYFDLIDSLNTRLEQLLRQDKIAAQDAQSRAAITAELEALEDHFGNALSLFDLTVRQKDSVPFSHKLMDASDTPAALIDRDGRIVRANRAAAEAFGFVPDHVVSEELFERGQFKNLLENLERIDDFFENKVISMFGMRAKDLSDPVHMALTRVDALGEGALGYLELAKVNWLPEKAAHFQSLFDLTPSEMDITKGLVNGSSLNDIAARRGRSIGTVRQQMKQLLAKLELRSQTELVCLYSGVVKYDGYAIEVAARSAPEEGVPAHRPLTFVCADQRKLEYEIVGLASDEPILFLPALLGGSAISPEMRASLAENRISLIIPWRPQLGNCDSCGPPKIERFEEYADDIAGLLDHLEIERIAVMGNITSAMFAYALGHYLPERISHVMNVNGIVPINSGAHVTMLNPAERLRFHAYRHLPKVANFIVSSMLRVVDSGQDYEFLRLFLDKNPEDVATTEREDIQRSFRAAHDYMTTNGFKGFVHELSLASLDWQYLIDDLACPRYNIVGEKNLSFTPELVRAFEREKRLDLNIEVVEPAGHLALYQHTEHIFREFARFIRQP